MQKLATVLMAVALLPACKKKENKPAEKPAEGKPAEAQKPTDKPADKPADATPMTPDQLGARYAECVGFWSAKDEAKVKTCFSADASIEMADSGMPAATGPDGSIAMAKAFWTGFPDIKVLPQLTIINGRKIVSVDWVSGTHTGEFMGMKPTNKKIGMLQLNAVDTNETGAATKLVTYSDMSTMMGQLGMNPAPHRPAMEKGIVDKHVIVVAKDSPEEQANIAAAKAGVDGVNEHSVDKFVASLTDDSMESDQTAAADLKGKQALGKHVKDFYTAFPDIKLNVESQLGAGDYVVNMGTVSGTNNGDMPEWGLKKTGKAFSVKYVEVMKVTGGKVAETWRFWNAFAMATQLGLVPPPGDAPKGDAANKDEKPAK